VIKVPANRIKEYTTFIELQRVPQRHQHYYAKWLRYYIDFCHKYGFPDRETRSLYAFLEKLEEKKQAEYLRKQAYHAVTLFQTMAVEPAGNKSLVNNIKADQSLPASQNIHNKKNVLNQEASKIVKPKHLVESSGLNARKQSKTDGADWTEVFDGLKSAIKIRHYSPTTRKGSSRKPPVKAGKELRVKVPA
jgi:hypothetical protein